MSDPTFWGFNDPAALVLGAALAAIIAVWGILSQRAIAARQTTLEYIRASESDLTTVKAREAFNALSKAMDGLGKWAADEHANSEETKAIRLILNEQELIAIAIQRGILDDTTYRRYFKSGVIRTWDAAAPYIMARRNHAHNTALYHEFEQLAAWYKGNAKPRYRFFFLRRFY
jgi:Domain of unknown function (DUF4760)